MSKNFYAFKKRGCRNTIQLDICYYSRGYYNNSLYNHYPKTERKFRDGCKSYDYKEILRGVTQDEYKNVVDEARELGLNNGWMQEEPVDLEELVEVVIV